MSVHAADENDPVAPIKLHDLRGPALRKQPTSQSITSGHGQADLHLEVKGQQDVPDHDSSSTLVLDVRGFLIDRVSG